MKKIFLHAFIALIGFVTHSPATVLLSFKFGSGINDEEPYVATQTINPHLTVSSGLSVAAGLTASSSSTSWSASRDFNNPVQIDSLASAIEYDVYYSFSITVEDGYRLNLNQSILYQNFNASTGIEGVAPNNMLLMYGPSGFTVDDSGIGYSDFGDKSLAFYNNNLITGLDNLTGTVEFRLYAWTNIEYEPSGTEDPSDLIGSVSLASNKVIGPFVQIGGGVYTPILGESVILDGTISVVPETQSILLILLGGTMLLGRRKLLSCLRGSSV